MAQFINKLRTLTARDYFLGPKKWRNKSIGAVWRFIVDYIRTFGHFNIMSKAATITYYLIFAIIPLVILLLMILTLVGEAFLINSESFAHISEMIPKPVHEVIRLYLPKINLSPSISSVVVAVILTLWTASLGFATIFSQIVSIYPQKTSKVPLPGRVAGLLFTIVFMLLLIITTLLMSFGSVLFSFINSHFRILNISDGIVNLLLYSIGWLMILFTFWLLFYFASRRSSIKMKTLPGAIFSSISWVAVSYFYSAYISSKSNMTSLYGGLVNIIVLLLWLNFSCLLVLCGALLNYHLTWNKLRVDQLDLLADNLLPSNALHYAPLKSPDKLSKEKQELIADRETLIKQAATATNILPEEI